MKEEPTRPSRLAALAKATKNPTSTLLLRSGEVTAIDAVTGTVSVKKAGSATVIPGVFYLQSYAPTVAQNVFILEDGQDLLVLGAVRGGGGGGGGTAWTDFSLAGGWGDWGGGFYDGQYRKVGDIVYLRGLVKNTSGGSKASGSRVTTLPTGHRPLMDDHYLVSSNGGLTIGLNLRTNGDLEIADSLPNNNYIAVSGLDFSTS